MEQFKLFLFSLLLLLLISSIILKKTRRRNSRRVPGPRRLPIVGNLHLLNPNNPHHSLLSLSLKHGPLMLLQLGPTPTLVISSAAVAEQIFRHHDLSFSGRPPLAAAKRLSYNFADITFSPHGEYWRQARKTSVLGLLSPRRVRALAAVRREEVRELISAVKDLPVVNLSHLSLSLANNVVCRAALGDEYGGGAKYGAERGVWLHEILSEAQRLLGGFWAADYFPAMAWVDRFVLGLRARLEKNFEELDKFYDEAIRKHQIIQKEEEDGGRRSQYFEDFLHYLLSLHDVAPAGSFLGNVDHVKGILTDVFIAGTDTSSATITWTMTELMRNPRVMHKLQQEMQQFPLNLINENELEKLEYLRQVIKESLRLHPPAPLLVPRETIAPCEIHGYAIPPKTRVLINAAAISTDPNVWAKPLEFWPERFDGGGGDFRGQDFAYLPFGAGRRKCPGIDFAIVLVELVVANLVHFFDWSMPEGMKVEDINMEEAVGITMHKKEPLVLVSKPKI